MIPGIRGRASRVEVFIYGEDGVPVLFTWEWPATGWKGEGSFDSLTGRERTSTLEFTVRGRAQIVRVSDLEQPAIKADVVDAIEAEIVDETSL